MKLEVAPKVFEGEEYDKPVITATLYINGRVVEKDGIKAYTVLHESDYKNFSLKNEGDRERLSNLRNAVIERSNKGVNSFVAVESISPGYLNLTREQLINKLSDLKILNGVYKITVSWLDPDTGIPTIEYNGQKYNVRFSGRPYLAVQVGTVNGKPVYNFHELTTRKLGPVEIDNIIVPLINVMFLLRY